MAGGGDAAGGAYWADSSGAGEPEMLVQAKLEATKVDAGAQVEAARPVLVQAKLEATAAHAGAPVEAARSVLVQAKLEATVSDGRAGCSASPPPVRDPVDPPTLRLVANGAPVHGPESTKFSLAVHHGGFFVGTGVNSTYLDGKLAWFDNLDRTYFTNGVLSYLVQQLGYPCTEMVDIWWCPPGKSIYELVEILFNCDEMAAASIENKLLVIFLHHVDRVRVQQKADDVCYEGCPELPEVILSHFIAEVLVSCRQKQFNEKMRLLLQQLRMVVSHRMQSQRMQSNMVSQSAEPPNNDADYYEEQYAYYEESEEEGEGHAKQAQAKPTNATKIDKGKGKQEQPKENVSARGRKRKPTTKAKEQLELLLHIAKKKKSKQIIDENGDIDFPVIRTHIRHEQPRPQLDPVHQPDTMVSILSREGVVVRQEIVSSTPEESSFVAEHRASIPEARGPVVNTSGRAIGRGRGETSVQAATNRGTGRGRRGGPRGGPRGAPRRGATLPRAGPRGGGAQATIPAAPRTIPGSQGTGPDVGQSRAEWLMFGNKKAKNSQDNLEQKEL